MTIKWWGVGLSVALLLATTAACSSATTGSGSGSIASSASDQSPSPTTSRASSASTSASASNSASSSSPVAAACTNAQLKVTWTDPPGGGAAGHRGIVLLFTNTSSATCVLSGYPGVDGLNAAGQHVASATRTLSGMIGFCGCTTPPTVTLTPGTVVSAVTEGVADGSGPCAVFPALAVTPPNTTVSTQLTGSPYSCGFTVHPVVTGTAGQSGVPH